MKPHEKIIKRRRVPRRTFKGRIGLLVSGQYAISQAHQVGEGGMLISATSTLKKNQQLVITFRLPGHTPDVVRAVVRYLLKAEEGASIKRFGVEFLNLDFHIKRQIRNYVATQLSQSTRPHNPKIKNPNF